jgi:DNA-directed RNA polymerase specialized sigma24 family protein
MSPLDGIATGNALTRYRTAMAQLSPADRELIIQRFELERSYEEIAQYCGLDSADKARASFGRALHRLAAGMAGTDATLPITERRIRLPRPLRLLLRWPWRDSDPD